MALVTSTTTVFCLLFVSKYLAVCLGFYLIPCSIL